MNLKCPVFKKSKLLPLLAFILCLGLSVPYSSTFANPASPMQLLDELALIKELAGSSYKGRVPGSSEYAKAADLVKQQFKSLGIAPFAEDYLMTYPTSLATFADKPTLTVDGRHQTIMTDFKPHGMSGSGTVKSKELVFVGNGYPEEMEGVSVMGRVVLMDAEVKPGKSLGVADRMALLKQKGAKAIFMMPTATYPIESFERPLNGADSGIVSMYIRRNLFDTTGLKPGDTIAKPFEMNVMITRNTNVISQNVAGFIPGKDPHRTLVISATLDGLGSIPNTAVFGSASMNGSGVAAVLSLAKYYKEHPPATNILFAIIGSETTNRDGIKQFIQDYSAVSTAKIIGFFNLYDLGGSKQLQKMYAAATNQSPVVPYLKGNKNISYAENGVAELYNFNNPFLENMGIPNVFFRGADSIDSVHDTANGIQLSKLKAHIQTIRDVIDAYINDPHQAIYVKPSTVQPDSEGKVYVPEVGHKMSFFTTRYFDVYYEADRWKEPEGLKTKLDRIYETIAWWNYYPQDSERIKIYYTNSYEDNWATAHRTPEPQNKTSGALQSPDYHSVSVVYNPNTIEKLGDSVGSIYHELNHNLATYKLKELGYGNWFNPEVQEIQGHANNYESKEQGRQFLAGSLSATLQKPLKDIRWDQFTTPLEDGKEMDSTYHQTASLIFFLYCNYSEDKGRELAYRMYTEDRKEIKDLVEETVGVPFQDVLQQWYDWYRGKEVKVPSFKTAFYSPPASTQRESTSTGGTKIDGNLVTLIDNKNADLKISSVTAVKKGIDLSITISYTSKKNWSLLMFVPPETEILRLSNKLQSGTREFTFKVPISKLKNMKELTLNVFNDEQDNVMVVDMNELDKVIK